MARVERRELAVRWLLPVGVVLLLVAVLGLVGGFRTARGDAGPAVAPGDTISLARWDIAVDRVELVDTTVYDSPTTTNMRVHLTVTATGEESVFDLPSGLVTVVAPDGPPAARGYHVDPVQDSGLDPEVTRTFVLDAPWPAPGDDGEQAAAPEDAPATVAVVVRDETYGAGPLFGPSWGIADVAGVVTLPLTDARVGS